MGKLRSDADPGEPPRARAGRRSGTRHRMEPDPLAARVGERIRVLRRESKLTFDAFVAKSGLGRGYVSELERGLVMPTIGVLARVAGALELTMSDLVAGETERERLFSDLRGRPSTFIRALRAEIRKAAAPRPPAA